VDEKKISYARIWFFLGILILQLLNGVGSEYIYWSQWPESLHDPIPILQLLEIKMTSPQTTKILAYIFFFFCITSCLGIFTRVSVCFSFVLSLYLNSFRGFVVFQGHNMIILFIAHFLLCVSPGVDCFSLDKKMGWNKSKKSKVNNQSWVFQLILFMWLLMFFSAGLSKLRESGLDWVTETPLYGYMGFWILNNPPFFGDLIYRLPKELMQLVQLFVLSLELFALLGLIKRIRKYFIASLFFQILCTFLFMGPNFLSHICILGFFLPLEKGVYFIQNKFIKNEFKII